jgi:hypothetical protein
MTDVSVSGATLTVQGEPGKLTLSEGFFVSFDITSEQEFLALAHVLAAEAKKAWPSITIAVHS